MPSWTLADRLRKIRRDVLDVEQREFAAQLGVTSQAYAAWEAGRNTPREVVAVSRRIELLTGVPATWLLGLDGPPDEGEDGPSLPINRDCSRTAGSRHALMSFGTTARTDGSDDWAEWRTAS